METKMTYEKALLGNNVMQFVPVALDGVSLSAKDAASLLMMKAAYSNAVREFNMEIESLLQELRTEDVVKSASELEWYERYIQRKVELEKEQGDELEHNDEAFDMSIKKTVAPDIISEEDRKRAEEIEPILPKIREVIDRVDEAFREARTAKLSEEITLKYGKMPIRLFEVLMDTYGYEGDFPLKKKDTNGQDREIRAPKVEIYEAIADGMVGD